MLKSILTILTVLIISTCIQTSVDTQTSCIDANPYIKVLQKERGLKVLPHPTGFTKSTCEGLWKAHGVCCEESSAITYAKSDAQAIRSSVDRFISSMKKLAPLYFEFMKKAPKIKKMVSPAYQAFIEVVEKNQAPNLTKILTEIQKSDKVKKSLVQCWDKMIKVRSSSVCSTCSGKSSVYFKGDKGLVKDSDCVSILDHCTDSFQMTFDLFIDVKFLMTKLSAFAASIGKGSLNSKHKKTVDKLNSFVKQVVESKILQSIDQYLKAASKKDSPQAGELCGRLVKLSEKTFIEELAAVASSIDDEMEDYMKQIGLVVFVDIIKTSFKKAGDKIKAGLSNWVDKLKKNKKRLMAELPAGSGPSVFDSGLLFGDVNVVSEEAMSSDTSLNGLQTIGLSASFP